MVAKSTVTTIPENGEFQKSIALTIAPRLDPVGPNRLKNHFQGIIMEGDLDNHCTFIRKNCVALEGENVKGEVAVSTLV